MSGPRPQHQARAPLRVGVISLGCAKNLVDTEVMLGHLERAGCAFVRDPAAAEVLIVNTCGFIGPAKEESIEAILEAAQLKKRGTLRRLVVAGCLVQRYSRALVRELPEVDAFVGLDEIERIVELVRGEAVRRRVPIWGPSRYLYDERTPRRRTTPAWSAYLKIAEGCDHRCAFCAIPSFRGRFRSRSLESILREARGLAAAGVRELNLVAQDSSHYGRDLGLEEGLARLLEELDAVEGLRWIRVHYLYPNTITPRLIETMARLPRVVKYVDLPLQHADAEVLRRMRRGGSAERHLELLEALRGAMPDGALRTTLIVGFPGETEAAFGCLVDFVQAARFDHLGVFLYSHEEGTAAAAGRDDVPQEVKEARRAHLMELQARIAAERNRRWVGRTVEVLVEGTHPETELLLVGRMPTQAPEVDGQVLIQEGTARAGDFVKVRIARVAGYDLVGRIVGAA